MADNLESYFKKHLSDEDPVEENWNVPSDDVWNKVLPEIQKKKGLFIPWKYLYIIGAVLVVGLAVVFWPFASSEKPAGSEKLNSSNTIAFQEDQNTPANIEKVASSNSEAKFNSSAKNESAGSTSDQKQSANANDDLPVESAKNLSNEKIVQSKLPIDNRKTKSTIISEDDFRYAATKNNSLTGISTTDKLNTDRNHRLANSEEKQDMNAVNTASGNGREEIFMTCLPLRKTENLITLSSADVYAEHSSFVPNSIPENDKTKQQPFDNKGKVGLGAFYAPTWNGTSLSGNPQTGEIQTSDMLLYSGNWGFEFKYFISNRFAIVAGVEKSEIKSWSKSLVDFNYDTSTEHIMPDGEKENTSTVPMQTPFGEIDTEVTYRFPGDQQIPDGEVMNSELETHQEVRYLSIPLGVEFNILRFSRFSWFAETGIRYNRALKDATNFSSRILHTGDDMAVVDEKMMSYPTYTENYLNFYIGTGMNYQVSSSFQINASGRYFGNITDVNLQGGMSTYVHGYSLKIGILYLF